MNLTLFFRLIAMSIFQTSLQKDYNRQIFYCPRVVAKDGWNVSLQIHHGNFCSSENGYRQLGHTFEEVEFGFFSTNCPELSKICGEDSSDSVGKATISLLESIFEKHGGIDWEATISIESFNNFVNL